MNFGFIITKLLSLSLILKKYKNREGRLRVSEFINNNYYR